MAARTCLVSDELIERWLLLLRRRFRVMRVEVSEDVVHCETRLPLLTLGGVVALAGAVGHEEARESP